MTRYGPKEVDGGTIVNLKLSHDGLSSDPQPPAVGTRNGPDQLTVGLACDTVPDGGSAARRSPDGIARTKAARAKRVSRGIGLLLSTSEGAVALRPITSHVRSTTEATPMREIPQKREGDGLIFGKLIIPGRGRSYASARQIKRAPRLESPEARPPDATGRRNRSEELPALRSHRSHDRKRRHRKQ